MDSLQPLPFNYLTWSSMFPACPIIPQPPVFQCLRVFSGASHPQDTRCAPTAPPSIPESFPLKQILKICHIVHTEIKQSR